MTNQISLMRDAEERSGVSPSRRGIFAYPKLFRVHQMLEVMLFVTLAAFAIRAWEFLSTAVILR